MPEYQLCTDEEARDYMQEAKEWVKTSKLFADCLSTDGAVIAEFNANKHGEILYPHRANKA